MFLKEVNICGIPYRVVEIENTFDTVCNFGMVDHLKCEIKINKNMSVEMKKQTLHHEILHAMLVLIGYDELSENEQFVQCLSNAMNQTYEVKNG